MTRTDVTAGGQPENSGEPPGRPYPHVQSHSPSTSVPGSLAARLTHVVRAAQGIRAWMVVVPVDVALLLLPITWTPGQWKATTAMVVLWLMLITSGGRYRARLHLSVLDDLPSMLGKLLTAAAVVATVIALRHEQDSVTVFLTNVAISIGLMLGGRVLTTRLIAWSRRRRLSTHRTVILGGGPLAAELAEITRANPAYGLVPVGFVDDGPDYVADLVVPYLGKLSDLDETVRTTGADVLLVADGQLAEHDLLEAVRTPECLPCDLLVVPRMHHFNTQTGMADHIGSIPIMRIRTPTLHGLGWAAKRAFDIVVGGLALLATLPVLLSCAAGVRFETGPGVIFRQPRVGRDGVVFDLLKFRSVRPASQLETETRWSVASDDRIGPIGRVLRRTSLDELPQLWNIVRGDMTLVGPRPERPYFVSRFSAEFDRYSHRHRVRAGLTGLAQVSGLRGDTSIADRTRYDNYYIENWSLWLDTKILIRTFKEVLLARGR